MIIRGPDVGSTGFAGVAFSAKHGELYGVSGGLNGYTAWIVPALLPQASASSEGGH